jgi:TonB family protein
MSIFTRVFNPFRRGVLERDLEDEVRFHLAERAAANVALGMEQADALAAAQRQFGDVTRVKTAMREVHMMNRKIAGAFVLGLTIGVSMVGLAWRMQPSPATASSPRPAFYLPGQEGTTMPVLMHEAKPRYTPDAMRAKIQGTVLMECVVQENGTCGNVRVTRSLEPGLDREAVNALQGWRFEPGKRQGRPVPVIVTIEMAFTLRS